MLFAVVFTTIQGKSFLLGYGALHFLRGDWWDLGGGGMQKMGGPSHKNN